MFLAQCWIIFSIFSVALLLESHNFYLTMVFIYISWRINILQMVFLSLVRVEIWVDLRCLRSWFPESRFSFAMRKRKLIREYRIGDGHRNFWYLTFRTDTWPVLFCPELFDLFHQILSFDFLSLLIPTSFSPPTDHRGV